MTAFLYVAVDDSDRSQPSLEQGQQPVHLVPFRLGHPAVEPAIASSLFARRRAWQSRDASAHTRQQDTHALELPLRGAVARDERLLQRGSALPTSATPTARTLRTLCTLLLIVDLLFLRSGSVVVPASIAG